MPEAAVARALKERFASFGITHLVVEDLQAAGDGTVDAVLLNTRSMTRVRLNVNPETGAIVEGEVMERQPAPCSAARPAFPRACEV